MTTTSTTFAVPTLYQFVDQVGGNVAASSWEAFLTTPTGQQMLSKVQQSAQEGVQKAASENAINLMIFALAGGTVGGALFRGPLGAAAAVALTLWAGKRIIDTTKSSSHAPAMQGIYPHGHCSR